MPSLCAVSVICWAKSSTEPPTPSASTTAMSLADFTIIILSALSTVSWVPTGRPILTGACRLALRETVNSVSKVMRLSLTAFKVMYSVISLVVDAGYHG